VRATTDKNPMVVSRRVAVMMVVLGLLAVACGDVPTGSDRVRGSDEVTVETRSIAEFERVVLAGEGDVLLGNGSDGLVEIETDDNLLTHIRTEVSGDTLTISTEPGIDIDPTDGVIYRLGCPVITAVTLSGAGSIIATGRTDRLDVVLAGAGDFDGRDLRADAVSVESLGVGTTTLWAVTELDVSVTGVGTVRYYGEPEVNSTVTGVGTIEALGPK